jgi:hypothetical protein
MTYESFELSFDKGLARLTLNLPQLGNALTETTCRELALVADASTFAWVVISVCLLATLIRPTRQYYAAPAVYIWA